MKNREFKQREKIKNQMKTLEIKKNITLEMTNPFSELIADWTSELEDNISNVLTYK